MADVPEKPQSRLHDIRVPKKVLTPGQRKKLQVKAFRPLAIELGWVAYEWNRLHESLGEIFAGIISGTDALPLNEGMRAGLAAWHSLTNERAQRDMLEAAINARFLLTDPKPKAHAEITWILKKLKALAGRRNDALHAPLAFITQMGADEREVEILPYYFLGNARAAGLKGKPLLEEFRWYRDHLEKLADYAESIIFAMKFSDYAWRDRPQLLDRGKFVSPAVRHRKAKAK